MAPELVKGLQYSTPVDIWAVGILALELAESEPPFISIPPVRTVYLISTMEPPKLQRPDNFSEEFSEFLSS
jgi:serine/threonine protein kinase